MSGSFKTAVLMRRIDKFEKAAVAVSWAGSQAPEDRAQIQADYKKARLDLVNYIIEHAI